MAHISDPLIKSQELIEQVAYGDNVSIERMRNMQASLEKAIAHEGGWQRKRWLKTNLMAITALKKLIEQIEDRPKVAAVG